jgi:single-stranded DNA-binding protein
VKERTSWNRAVFFKDLAEKCVDIKKGNKLKIVGYLQTRKWMDKGTQEARYITEIIGNELNILSSSSAWIPEVSGTAKKICERNIREGEINKYVLAKDGGVTLSHPMFQEVPLYDDDLPF